MTDNRDDPAYKTVGELRQRFWQMINVVQATISLSSPITLSTCAGFIESLNHVDITIGAAERMDPNRVPNETPIPEIVFPMIESVEETYREIVHRYSN